MNQKNLVSVKFVSAILGPEMAAPILWTPGKKRPFCRKNLHVHKIPRFRGGYLGFFFGGGECRFYFYGRGDFSEINLICIYFFSVCNDIWTNGRGGGES